MFYLCHYGRALLTFWFQTDLGRENSASYLRTQAGKIDAFNFSQHSHALSRSTSNLQTLIGQNLIGEVMRKIYTTSWNLFTLTAEADGIFCQLAMFLTVLFHWMHKMMKYSCYQESSLNVGNPISDGIVFVFHPAGGGLKSLIHSGPSW